MPSHSSKQRNKTPKRIRTKNKVIAILMNIKPNHKDKIKDKNDNGNNVLRVNDNISNKYFIYLVVMN